jgi:NAD(P)-dependent dehydrogenase (short-subunit alcohol dehydrogenase family)
MPSEAHLYTAPSDVLENRVILVTGAGDGIGQAAARRFAAHGAQVILAGRTQVKLEAVYDAIVADGHPTPQISVIDFSQAQGDDYQDIAEALETEYGRLDGLLHNAGILGQRSPIEHYDVATWLNVMHVNLNAAFILTQSLIPLLQKSTDASIVFTSSGVGRVGRAFWGAYAASKFATEGLAQVLANELNDVRVNCINPGATRTAMRKAAFPGEDPTKLTAANDLMPAYLYLLGPASKGITGQSIDCQPK